MKTFKLSSILAFLLAGLLAFSSFSYALTGDIQYCFTPGENCTQEIADAIDSAHKTLFIQAYQFTSAPIAKALVEAKKRGIDTRIILDKTQYSLNHYSSAVFFEHAGIPVWIDRKVSIAHNKVMIIDSRLLITGSFNFTQAAQNRNAENVLMITSPELAKAYTQNWEKRQAVSVPLEDYVKSKIN